MKPNTIRKIFIALIIFLPVQYGIVGIVSHFQSEPWPAFVFPGFKNVFVFDDLFVLNQVYFEIEGEEVEPVRIRPRHMFYDMPVSKINGFMRKVFPDQDHINNFDSSTTNWLYQRASEVTQQDVELLNIVRVREFTRLQDGELKTDSSHVDQTIELRRLAYE